MSGWNLYLGSRRQGWVVFFEDSWEIWWGSDPPPRTVLARGTKLMCHGICAGERAGAGRSGKESHL